MHASFWIAAALAVVFLAYVHMKIRAAVRDALIPAGAVLVRLRQVNDDHVDGWWPAIKAVFPEDAYQAINEHNKMRIVRLDGERWRVRFYRGPKWLHFADCSPIGGGLHAVDIAFNDVLFVKYQGCNAILVTVAES
ncbi:MAG: hypothetical protein WC773_03595 [Patescibacteria group bacterium]|jgi:hypothetical protein